MWIRDDQYNLHNLNCFSRIGLIEGSNFACIKGYRSGDYDDSVTLWVFRDCDVAIGVMKRLQEQLKKHSLYIDPTYKPSKSENPITVN